MLPRYTLKIGTAFVLVVGLMLCTFGCGSATKALGLGEFDFKIDITTKSERAIKDLGLVFDNPKAAGRPSPSFNADIAPILTSRCAIAECHVLDGPHDIDLRTYDSLIKGGDEGAIVIAGNARKSEMVEEIVESKMPPKGFPLKAAQIQLIIDWINEGAKNN